MRRGSEGGGLAEYSEGKAWERGGERIKGRREGRRELEAIGVGDGEGEEGAMV